MKAIYVGKSDKIQFGTVGEIDSNKHIFMYRDLNKNIQHFDYSDCDKNEILFMEYQNMMMGFNQWLHNKTILLIAEHNKLFFSKYCTTVCHYISFNKEYVISAKCDSKWYIPDWDLTSLWVIDNCTATEFHTITIEEYIRSQLNTLPVYKEGEH